MHPIAARADQTSKLARLRRGLSDLFLRGYALFPEMTEGEFVELMNHLGPTVPQPRADGPIKDLVLSEVGVAGSFSARFGLAAFPPHTDGAHLRKPPRWVGLRLVTATSIACGAAPVVDGLTQDEEQALRRATWLIRGPSTSFLSPLLDRSRTLRFDPLRFAPHHSDCGGALRILSRALARVESIKLVGAAQQVLVLDNWRCLHWRMPGLTEEVGIRRVQRIVVGGEDA